MPRIAILGCGPAGLIAAQAVANSRDCSYEIISRKQPSKQYGAQWIHEPIPGITSESPDGEVVVHHLGDADGYAKKVYGAARAETSFGEWGDPERPSVIPAWDMRTVYARLWETHEDRIIDRDLSPDEVLNIVQSGTYDAVISSVPRRAICRSAFVNPDEGPIEENHEFKSQKVWVRPSDDVVSGNEVVYNGNLEPAWSRYSSVFGHAMYEYGDHSPGKPPLDDVVPIEKPLATTCNCWRTTGPINFVGRYGIWSKKVLAHHAYDEAAHVIESVVAG